ncbi:MAG: acyl-CoA thioesterase [Planctomycetota bacterium]|nr:MAG: acyl-CoA thioesterase [Planctomycetota bacterium]
MDLVPPSVPEEIRVALKDYTTITVLPVQWGDQDAFGHVNNVVYFRWFESARIDLLHEFPTSVTMSGSGLGPILASIKCDYRKQLRFPDTVYIGSRMTRVGRSSADIGHFVISHQQGQLVAEGSSVIVIFDYTAQRVTRIPEDLRTLFEDSMKTV